MSVKEMNSISSEYRLLFKEFGKESICFTLLQLELFIFLDES